MEIKSAPEPTTVEVTDFDIRFAGETLQLTLHDGDTMTEVNNRIVVSLPARPDFGRPWAEESVINIAHVLWTSTRKRKMTILPDPADGPAHKRK